MWTVPAVQVADAPLARELILRMCEVHGYAPGRGVNYLDGTLFAPGFTLEGASAYAIATDRYIRDTGDDQIVEEPVLADTLYHSSDDIADRRDEHFALYRSDVTLGGAPSTPQNMASTGSSSFSGFHSNHSSDPGLRTVGMRRSSERCDTRLASNTAAMSRPSEIGRAHV